jgi:hypothetical protein
MQRAGVDRLGNKNISHEADGIEKRYQEDQVADYSVKECKDSTHVWNPPAS